MSECEKMNCGYWWKEEGEDYPRCHWEDDGFPAPCEYDDDFGFDPYEGCYTYDC